MKIKFNSDKDIVKEIKKQVKENDGYCPCQLARTPDTKCMCKAFREQTTPGACHCGLYIKIDDGDIPF